MMGFNDTIEGVIIMEGMAANTTIEEGVTTLMVDRMKGITMSTIDIIIGTTETVTTTKIEIKENIENVRMIQTLTQNLVYWI